MIIVFLRYYCIIENLVVKDKEGKVLFDESGQLKFSYVDLEIRFFQELFFLYFGEVLKQVVILLKVILVNFVLRLRAVLDFEDDFGEKRVVGDEWLFEGLGIYIL